MKLLPSVLLAAAVAVAPSFLSMMMVDSAAVACEGICEVPLPGTCEEVLDEFEFSGDCCSLQEEDDGNCTLVTTTQCYFQVQGDTGCETLPDGSVACVVPGTDLTANSDEECPESDFEVLMMDDDSNSTSTAPAGSSASTSPSPPTDTGAGVTSAPSATPSSADSVTTRLIVNLSLMVAGGVFLLV
jgi:hypothetical protein